MVSRRLMLIVVLAAAFVVTGQYDAFAEPSFACRTPPCPGEEPVPELELMMVPAAMGAAGFLAYRARRKAARKNDKA